MDVAVNMAGTCGWLIALVVVIRVGVKNGAGIPVFQLPHYLLLPCRTWASNSLVTANTMALRVLVYAHSFGLLTVILTCCSWAGRLLCLPPQAVITGREGGVAAILQRAHHTMQALVSAEEALGRARQRTEQAAQQVQRALRAQQGGAPQVIARHQAVRITLGPSGAQPGGGGAAQGQQAGAAGQPGQGAVAIPLGQVLQQLFQGAVGGFQGSVAQAQQAPAAGAAGAAQPQQAPAAGAAGAAGPGVGFTALAQQLMGTLGLPPADQQQLLQQVGVSIHLAVT